MIFQSLHSGHCEQVYEVYRASYKVPEHFSAICGYLRAPASLCFGAFDFDRLVGVALGHKIKDDYLLIGCYVLPEFQNGVGVRLAAYAFGQIHKWFPQADVYFSTALSNQLVQKLALAANAELIMQRNRHLVTGEDAYLYKIGSYDVERTAKRYFKGKELHYARQQHQSFKLWELK